MAGKPGRARSVPGRGQAPQGGDGQHRARRRSGAGRVRVRPPSARRGAARLPPATSSADGRAIGAGSPPIGPGHLRHRRNGHRARRRRPAGADPGTPTANRYGWRPGRPPPAPPAPGSPTRWTGWRTSWAGAVPGRPARWRRRRRPAPRRPRSPGPPGRRRGSACPGRAGDDQAAGEDQQTPDERKTDAPVVGHGAAHHDADQAGEEEGAEDPAVEPQVAEVAADHREDGRHRQALEGHDGHRQGQAGRQPADAGRPQARDGLVAKRPRSDVVIRRVSRPSAGLASLYVPARSCSSGPQPS